MRHRRRVPALGSRHGGRRPADGDQPVRRAERAAGQGRHARAAGRLPDPAGTPPGPRAARRIERRRADAERSRRAGASRRRRRALSPRVARPATTSACSPTCHPTASRSTPRCRSIRAAVGTASGCATMFGYGPRYLHSTGQLHKGGANNGVFVIVTAAAQEDLPIPDEPFSFGVLEMAQALGDFESLDQAPAAARCTCTCRGAMSIC